MGRPRPRCLRTIPTTPWTTAKQHAHLLPISLALDSPQTAISLSILQKVFALDELPTSIIDQIECT